MSRRDRALEAKFLAAAKTPGPEGDRWSERVLERIDEFGERKGRDIPDHLTMAALIDETRQESLDLAGWSLMILHVARERGMPEAAIGRLRERLAIVAELGAAADLILERALHQLPPERATLAHAA